MTQAANSWHAKFPGASAAGTHGARVGSLVGVWVMDEVAEFVRVLDVEDEVVGIKFLQLSLMRCKAICRPAPVQAFSVQLRAVAAKMLVLLPSQVPKVKSGEFQ